MRSMEKRQYEIEQGLRDPSELLGGKEKADEGEEDEDESEAAIAAKKENLTKNAMAIAAKGLKSSDPLERMKAVRLCLPFCPVCGQDSFLPDNGLHFKYWRVVSSFIYSQPR